MKSSKSKKIAIHLIIIVSILYSITIFLEQKKEKPEVCIDTHCVHVSIANTDESREKGLMFVQKMDESSGMIFVFDSQGFYPFWMKNTLIPLDMIRINKQNKIVDIQTAIPCTTEQCKTYGGNQPASYVLEINAGLAQKRGLQTGQEVTIDL